MTICPGEKRVNEWDGACVVCMVWRNDRSPWATRPGTRSAPESMSTSTTWKEQSELRSGQWTRGEGKEYNNFDTKRSFFWDLVQCTFMPSVVSFPPELKPHARLAHVKSAVTRTKASLVRKMKTIEMWRPYRAGGKRSQRGQRRRRRKLRKGEKKTWQEKQQKANKTNLYLLKLN
jgi:hypothetical protein